MLCCAVLLCRSMPRNKAWPLGIILCPTRELAHQLAGQASHLVAGSQLTVKCVTGGASLTEQVCAAVFADVCAGATKMEEG
jgi:superfamily II DNA/RNA helicase